jgi:hypothetical protein
VNNFQHRYPTRCPHCHADLTLPASLVLHFNVADRLGEVASQLDPRGWLEDVDDLIAHGHHSGTVCKACGEGLDAYESFDNPSAALDSHDVTAVPKLLAACQAVVANWEHGDLAHAARMCAEAVEATKHPTMKDAQEGTVSDLLSKAKAADLVAEDLDEAVHDMASSIASNVNNSGIDGQLAFLLDNMGYDGTSTRLDELAAIVHAGEL